MGLIGDLFASKGSQAIDQANAEATIRKAKADEELATAIAKLAAAPLPPPPPPMTMATKITIGAGVLLVFMTTVWLMTRKK